jgi:hypothetical protein
MKLTWSIVVIVISFALMWIIKREELKQFNPYFQGQRTFKLSRFEAAKKIIKPDEVELLELWESMLTGRSAPVSRWIKEQYKSLGLNHLFTPSGFHLSAVMLPFMRLIKNKTYHLWLLVLIAGGVFCMTGQGALKRMALIKLNQQLLGQKTGFILALLLDILFGSFMDSPLSFVYSFLFLGIIYSGSGWLFLWFFFAQSLIAYFSGELISPLIMLFSPLLNLAFAVSMPFLFLLAFPLWHWQLNAGLLILSGLQKLVSLSASLSLYVPSWEINFGVLVCFALFYFRHLKSLALALLILTNSLNLDQQKNPSFGPYDYVPQGHIVKVVSNDIGEVVYWSDGKCKRELVRGVWWEKCSPRRRYGKRRSTRKFRLKKLSSVLLERRKFFLRG